MSKYSRFAALRTLLSRSPSLRVWNQLLRLISNASEQEQGILVEYAMLHLDAWPDEVRVLDYVDDTQAIWPLIRQLSFVRRAPALFDQPYSVHTSFRGNTGTSLWEGHLWPASFHIKQFRGAVNHLSGDHEVFRKVVSLLPEKLPSLSHLSLSLSGDLQTDTGRFLMQFANLQSLTLQSREWYANNLLFGVHSLTDLRELCIEGNRAHRYVSRSPDNWIPLPPRLHRLRMANLFGVSDLRLLKNQKELRRLSLGELSWVQWVRYGMEPVYPTDWELLTTLPVLEELELLSCRHLVSLEVFGGLTGLTRLKLTGLNRCRELSGLGRLQALENLELMGLSDVNLEGLESLSSLKRLRLHISTEPTERDWKEWFRERCPRLESLELRFPSGWQKVEFAG